MYGALNTQGKSDQWEYIQNLSDELTGPWMLVGDMNFILDNSEKEGGNDSSSSAAGLIQRDTTNWFHRHKILWGSFHLVKPKRRETEY